MDISRNLDIKELPEINLNDLCRSFHDGVYTFTPDKSKKNNNFPANNLAGFLFVNTDFDETLCIQKITTLGKKFYFRTGNKVNNIFEWSEWDKYATIADIPAKSLSELDDDFITKKEYFPKPNKNIYQREKGFFENESNPGFANTPLFYNRESQLSGILQQVYKNYGELPEYIPIQSVPKYLDEHGFMKDRGKAFILGYFVRENDIIDDERNGVKNHWPTKKAGILQVFSSISRRDASTTFNTTLNEFLYQKSIPDNSRINSTLIFTEFETGKIYLTRISDWSVNAFVYSPETRTYYGFPGDEYDSEKIIWDEFITDPKIIYDMNKSGLDLLKMKSILPPVNISFQNESNSINDPRNNDFLKEYNYKEFGNITKVYSWSNDNRVNVVNNDEAIPYFYSGMTDKDYTLISSLFPNGCYAYTTDKLAPDNRTNINDPKKRYLIYPVFNTFNFSYSTIKLTKNIYKNLEVEKVNT